MPTEHITESQGKADEAAERGLQFYLIIITHLYNAGWTVQTLTSQSCSSRLSPSPREAIAALLIEYATNPGLEMLPTNHQRTAL